MSLNTKPTDYSLIIDDRERHVTQYINDVKTDILYKITRINIGDYAIMYKDQIIAIIERKSWKDLASSFRDGRKENVEKLIELRNKIGCKIMYLIEGKERYKETKRHGRIPFRYLEAHLDHLIFRDEIHIIYAKDVQDCLPRLFALITNISTINGVKAQLDAMTKNVLVSDIISNDSDKEVNDSKIVDNDSEETDNDSDSNEEEVNDKPSKTNINDFIGGDNEEKEQKKANKVVKDKSGKKGKARSETTKARSKTTKVKKESSKNESKDETNISDTTLNLLKTTVERPETAVQFELLKCISKIGSVLAEKLLAQNIYFADLYNFDTVEDKLKKIDRIEALTIKNIKASINSIKLGNVKAIEPIISTFKGISKKSAQYLLKTLDFNKLMQQKITREELARMNKSETAKIGLKTAGNIFNTLKLK